MAAQSLKSFKDAMLVGSRWRITKHWIPRHAGTVRTVTKRQTNGYWFLQENDTTRYWGEFPKASQLRWDGSLARVNIDDGRFWFMERVGPPAPSHADTLVCYKCASNRVLWAGWTERALRRDKPSRDVQQCLNCGTAWYFARTGRRMYTRRWTTGYRGNDGD